MKTRVYILRACSSEITIYFRVVLRGIAACERLTCLVVFNAIHECANFGFAWGAYITRRRDAGALPVVFGDRENMKSFPKKLI